MEELVDVVKGQFTGRMYTDGAKAVAVYIPADARNFLDIKPPHKPRFKVFLDKNKRRIIYEFQDFIDKEG